MQSYCSGVQEKNMEMEIIIYKVFFNMTFCQHL